ncbi:MAG TPA: hydrogenase 2 operon protein HybA [Candidatus Eisenbacteria bacterium]|nr:hydrogenase 2 operon protein HybA [Candidatus Eisenbacteria bacterium]
MDVNRRDILKALMSGSALAAMTTAGAPVAKAGAGDPVPPLPDAMGLMYDATVCIGCRACMPACQNANGLKPDLGASGGLYMQPDSLNAHTKNLIKLYVAADGHERSFMKQQCMHCVDPACVSGCPMKALHKEPHGVVGWNPTVCIGCRYCQIACPFNIPKFEWDKVNPKIVKCELCRHIVGKTVSQPACTQVCPTHAVIYGKRSDLLAEAHLRIKAKPGFYFEDRVYGETEGGGTQCLVLSHVDYSKLGLPKLGKESPAAQTRRVSEFIYRGFLTPVVAYAGIVGIVRNRWREHLKHTHPAGGDEAQGEEKKA